MTGHLEAFWVFLLFWLQCIRNINFKARNQHKSDTCHVQSLVTLAPWTMFSPCDMLKKRKTPYETLITWKKYSGNQCKLIVISKV